jgi:hypothetical protein
VRCCWSRRPSCLRRCRSALGSDGWGRLGGAVATGGEDSVVQCSGGGDFPSLAAPLSRSGLGFRWGEAAHGKPRDESRRPPPCIYSAV